MQKTNCDRYISSIGLLLFIFISPLCAQNLHDKIVFDLIIKNGTIVDGVSDIPYQADLGISKERIQTIGQLEALQGKVVIDATGKIVTPGFIDMHSHTDLELFVNPKAQSKIRQGVTTEFTGNCGYSAFPSRKTSAKSGEVQTVQRIPLNIDINWTNFQEYSSVLEKKKIGINYATLIGHGTLRAYVMGYEQRKPNKTEMQSMKKLVEQAMEHGAFGLSTGLEYAPGVFADSHELVELCQVVAQHGGIYATHIRNEDASVVEAISEAIHVAESAKIPLQISHLKVCGSDNYHKSIMIVDLIEKARKRGVAITADRYPYIAWNSRLKFMFPQWAKAGGNDKFIERLKDKKLRQKMKAETCQTVALNNSWENLFIQSVTNEKYNDLVGKNIKIASAKRKQDPYDFCCDLLISDKGKTGVVCFAMSKKNTNMFLKHPLVMLGSDGVALCKRAPLNIGIPHPRNYGSFPRFIRLYVREKKLLTLSQAIKKITSMPAAKIGIIDRGSIKKGNFADLVIFDLKSIADKATFSHPMQYPAGIDYVIINGTIVLDHGKHTGKLPGKVLYNSNKK